MPRRDIVGKLMKLNWITHKDIVFTSHDLKGIILPYEDQLVAKVPIAKCEVKRVLMDNRSSMDILLCEAFQALNLREKDLKLVSTPLVSFLGEVMKPLRMITLLVLFSEMPRCAKITVDFLVAKVKFSYINIIGWPIISALAAISSLVHQKMKFSTAQRVGEIKINQVMARKFYVTSLKRKSTDNPN